MQQKTTTKDLTVDDSGILTINGKKLTDHNTIILTSEKKHNRKPDKDEMGTRQ